MAHQYYRTTRAAYGHVGSREYLVGFTDSVLGQLYCSVEQAHGPEIADILEPVSERAIPGKTLRALLAVLALSTAVD